MKFYVEVYGCTANKSDANLVKGLIEQHPQHTLVFKLKDADSIVILTCTVISTTEQRMLHRINELVHTGKQVIIAGCMASVQQQLLKKQFPNSILISPQHIHLLFKIINNEQANGSLEKKAFAPKQCSTLIAPVAIAEGCLFSCSYCITHLARGKLYSYPEQAIINSVKEAVSNGCKEIQLTAQDTASYGIDKDSSLPGLLSKVLRIDMDFMIRLGMMNPRTAKNVLFDLIKKYQNDRIFSFVHIPIQSGDNTILQKMNRGYTIDEAINIIENFRKKIPDITISTDAIVGFPTETKTQFQKTKHLLQQIKPDVINITRFSARPFTKAKKMPGRIPTEIVKKRSRELSKICKNITTEKNKQYIGKTMPVIPLKKGKGNTVLARSLNYKPVVIKKPVLLGEKRTVNIIDATETHLVGMLK